MTTSTQLFGFFAAASDPIGVLDAITIIAAAAVLFLARAVLSLRQRVEELEQAKAATPVPAASAHTPAAVAVGTAPHADTIPADILAVIAAAVHVALPGNTRIVGISTSAAPTEDRAWSLEGRRQIFSSHKVR